MSGKILDKKKFIQTKYFRGIHLLLVSSGGRDVVVVVGAVVVVVVVVFSPQLQRSKTCVFIK